MQCPFKMMPELDLETVQIMEVMRDLNSPIGQARPELILECYKDEWGKEEILKIAKLQHFVMIMQQERATRKLEKTRLN